MSQVGSDLSATITTGLQRAVCSAFGGDCEVDETTTDESTDTDDPDRDYAEDMDESLGEGSPAPPETPAEHTTEPGEPPQSDPPPPVNEEDVEETLDLIEEWQNDRSFVDTVWPWTGTPSRTDIEQQLHDLNRGELDEVFSELSDEEIRELLGYPSSVDLLQDIVFDNASIETIRRIREVDPDYFIDHEPSYEGMGTEVSSLEDAEHGFPEDGSIWGEGDALDERISLEHINQGQISDCYFLAEVGAIAEQNPEIIDDMITENADGTFTVEFADGSDYTVRLIHGGTEKRNFWV